MSEQKPALPIKTAEELYSSLHATSAYAAHLAMDATFASKAAPRPPIHPVRLELAPVYHPIAA